MEVLRNMCGNIVSNLSALGDLAGWDKLVLAVYFAALFLVGFWTMKKSGKNTKEYFLSGQSMSWWLLGFSLVATTFAADTPNFVTELVRTKGVSANWSWWAFLLTGMTTVFIYAKLWRRLGVMTDIEFYEVRYGGKSASFLRGFRTVYLGLIVNTVVMANVILAIIKILNTMLGIDPATAVVFSCGVTVLFSAVGGLSAVIWADFILFIIAMGGAIGAAVYLLGLPEVGGLSGLLAHEEVVKMTSVLPNFTDTDAVIALLVIPLVVQWWSVWYPGAEPGGGSFGAQRMFAAKNESHAIGATLFFNFCHYAVRPWPWILVALASIVVYPDLASLREAFPNLPEHMIRDDMAYPAMLKLLPAGLFGIVLASLFAAFMSTVATLLNLGSSYMVNDFYHRFINPKASEKQLVFQGRLWTVILMVLACLLAFRLQSAKDNFNIILEIGAGTGLLFLIRWFWWRINAASEIAAMCLALPTAVYFRFFHVPLCAALFGAAGPDGQMVCPDALKFSDGAVLLITIAVTTIGWLLVTYLTRPTDQKILVEFLRRTKAGGPGWKRVVDAAAADGIDRAELEEPSWSVPLGILCSAVGCVCVYSSLFAVGCWIYAQWTLAVVLTAVAAATAAVLLAVWNRVAKGKARAADPE
ncbi:MAG: Na+:solute symporter [Thermoguttaceae bacterium]|nr:Na+:solute symporter [Thermoguttaceae bacterium]